ncbi:MAG: helix-turn-helix transcriptional regulator [Ruminococcaceae bacterium]|nr:helix-turn-helix transcriptional regulator [Oscillospiraceae bacterium]
MKFGESVRLFRQQKGLTQEKLGEMLGVSSQAVSKWETMESYPDAELLVPLANSLEVSLDVLFHNEQVTERDAAILLAGLIGAESKRTGRRPFETIRRLGWTMEAAMFGELAVEPERGGLSSISDEGGFTEISCEPDAPFFSVFTEPEGGWGAAVGDGEEIRAVFEALGNRPTMKAMFFLMRRCRGYLFEAARLAKETGISPDELGEAIRGLSTLGLVSPAPVEINGETRQLYYYYPEERVMSLLLFAKYLRYHGTFYYQSNGREAPLIRSDP